MWKYSFWQFSEKLVGDEKYLIVSDQKSFGRRFDHFNHPENILQPYSHHQTFFSKLKFRSWKFLFGVYVIVMEFFEVNKSLQCIVQGIRHVILHQINEFWWVRTHTWKNSSIFLMLKLSNFTSDMSMESWWHVGNGIFVLFQKYWKLSSFVPKVRKG